MSMFWWEWTRTVRMFHSPFILMFQEHKKYEKNILDICFVWDYGSLALKGKTSGKIEMAAEFDSRQIVPVCPGKTSGQESIGVRVTFCCVSARTQRSSFTPPPPPPPPHSPPTPTRPHPPRPRDLSTVRVSHNPDRQTQSSVRPTSCSYQQEAVSSRDLQIKPSHFVAAWEIIGSISRLHSCTCGG